jgi:hypothetical protein
MIDKMMSQIPMPELIPARGWAMDGFAAEANTAMPKMPKCDQNREEYKGSRKNSRHDMRRSILRSR